MIDYDPSREALYRPALRPPLFVAGAPISEDALCAEASRLSYLRFESDDGERGRLIQALEQVGLSRWAGFHAPKTGTEAFAAIREASGEALVVFRGTATGDFKDFGTDLNVRPTTWPHGGHVHGGFAAAFESVRADIEKWLRAHASTTTLTVTGHSLGAALATLAMSRWRARRLVTFGCPRVGDRQFAATIDAGSSIRYVGCCDLVCNVPPPSPWYVDVAAMRYIDRSGQAHEVISLADMSADRTLARREYFSRYAMRPGNVVIRDLADHAPINYVRALMPGQ